jgi:hypothetical protein
MALGSTQSVTEISTRNLPGGKGRPGLKPDNFTVIREPIFQKMWEASASQNPIGFHGLLEVYSVSF